MAEDLNMLNEQLNEEIAKRKQMEDALRESETRYRALFEGSPDAILLANPETGIIVDANPAASRLLARPYEKIVGLHQSNIHPPQKETYSRKAFTQHVKETKEQAESHPIENTVSHPDGSEVPVEVLAQLVTIKGKKVLQGVFRDITERKQAEQALRKSEERLRQAVRVSQIGIFDHDHLTDAVYWSPQQREIYGCSQDETITLSVFLDFVYPEDRERIALAVRHAHDPEGDGLFDVEHRIIRRDGTIRWVITRSQTFFDVFKDGSHRPIRTVGAVRDITQSKKADAERETLEAQFTQAQKMESVGRLAGGVAHDFNNILSAIVGYAHITLKKLPTDDLLRGYVEQILKASDRATILTQSLLSFSRKRIINLEPHNLNDIIKKFEKFLRRLIREDIEITTTCTVGNLTVLADKGQLEQVLMNLVTNARDAMSKGGHITIRTESIYMDEKFIEARRYGKMGKYALLLISDTGEGMDEKTRKKIFEPFFTTKGEGKGTGLGLSMAYGTVKQHNGFIDVFSEPNKGTTFEIYLPLVQGRVEEEKKDVEIDTIQGGSEILLIAEDDSALRELTAKILRDCGYCVIEAVDGQEAVTKFRENKDRVQLAILDVIMPKKNGKETYEEIRITNPAIKTIFVSGYPTDIISKEGLLEPSTNLILKPFEPLALLKKVREILDT